MNKVDPLDANERHAHAGPIGGSRTSASIDYRGLQGSCTKQ